MKKVQKAGKVEKGRILVTYKGSAEGETPFQDDSLILTLARGESLAPQACAVINFPVMNGKKAFFIHDIVSDEGKRTRDFLYGMAEKIARERGYQEIYINSSRFGEKFVRKNGFQWFSGGILAKKELGE